MSRLDNQINATETAIRNRFERIDELTHLIRAEVACLRDDQKRLGRLLTERATRAAKEDTP